MKKLIIAGILLGLFLKLFIFDILTISGISMLPILKSGQKVFINKAAYGLLIPFTSKHIISWGQPSKGKIVTFYHDNKIVIKRCVLTQGDSLEFLQNSGYYIKINSKNIPLTELQYLKLSKYSQVPEGFIFVLGDNFSDSIDSRDYGFVSVKSITGNALINE